MMHANRTLPGETYVDARVRCLAAFAASIATAAVLMSLDQTGVAVRRQALAERAAPPIAVSCGCPIVPRTGLVL